MSEVSTPTSRRGFTLIELLVVIAIIAILAAILFPVFAKAREKARAISCTSNMKQAGLAILQYNQDNDEKFPSGLGAVPNGTNMAYGQGWAGQVSPYSKSAGVFKCPDDSTTQTGTNPTRYPVSYAFNSNMANQTLATMNASASTVMLCELEGVAAPITQTSENTDVNGANAQDGVTVSPATNGLAGYIAYKSGTAPVAQTTPVVARYYTGALGGYATTPEFAAQTGLHTDGSNYLLGDGHVKFFRGAQVSPGSNGTPGNAQAQATSTVPQAAATDTMYSNTAKTQPVAATFSAY